MQPNGRINLNDLDTFERVARLGTLSAAAEELGVPKSTIGRHIARLEEAVKVALLHRGPRQVTLTESGVELEARSRRALLELRELSFGLAASRPHGVLRLTVLPDLMASTRFASLLTEYCRAYPDVVLDIDANPRVANLITEGFDVAFRPATAQVDTDTLVVRRLASSDGRLFASRTYVERRGTVDRIEDLEEHDWVRVGSRRQMPFELSLGGETRSLMPRVVAYGSDVASVLSLLRAGLGIGAVPPIYLDDEVNRGTVVPLLPKWATARTHLLMVWPRQRFLLPQVRAFVDFIVESFQES
ncbi:MAG: LysR family transcriptional regulator [Myxococcota bacterium]